MARGRHSLFVAAGALLGLVLFTYAIRNVGWANVVDGIKRVGWGMVPILAFAGLRFVLRSAAWRLCIPARARLSLPQAFAAFLAGDSLGNVTPLGLFASEPTKVFLIRHRLATREAVSSLAVDFVIYSTSAVTMIAVGLVLLLASVPLSLEKREIILVTLAGLGLCVFFLLRMMNGAPQVDDGQRPGLSGRLAALREAVFSFTAGHPSRVWRVFGLDLLFQGVAVMEVYLTLRWLMPNAPPTIAQAIMFGALDRAVIIAFKYVPFRLGIDETLSGGLSGMLFGNQAIGVALALIKKVRSIAWVAVGLILIAAHPSQATPESDPPGTGRVHPI